MSKWTSIKDSMPEVDKPIEAIVRFCGSGKEVTAELKRVDEDDCSWRTIGDNSELSYSCDVVKWRYL